MPASKLPAGLTVLIVDDDATISEMWCAVLSRAPGLRTATANNGREGVQMARSLQPDVVLMDLAMPEMDGLTATRLLKADPATARIPVVAVTGSMYGSQRVLEAGCDGYMTKPISPENLVLGISRVLRSAPRG